MLKALPPDAYKEVYDLLLKTLVLDESRRSFPYLDRAAKPRPVITVGIGRNLTDVGLSDDEIMYLYNNDILKAERTARSLIGDDIFNNLTLNRKVVVLNMSFNLGYERLMQFHSTLHAIKTSAFQDASTFMLKSLWAQQVGSRAVRLAKMMRDG